MSTNWDPFRPNDIESWNLRRVVHLHRCAGFAATWNEIQRDLNDGPDAAVGRVVKGTARIDGQRAGFEALSAQVADAAVLSGDADRLKAWWLLRMFLSPDPLAERLTLMWHNHFATSNFKVKDVAAMRLQNDTFRKLARAPFGELLGAMLHDPALLVWLDAPSNRKESPNENLSRELMELFTLGVGNFTEPDVKQAARTITGLSAADGEFRYRPHWHDDGEKTILGKTGALDAEGLREVLLANAATPRRLAWRICTTFLGEKIATDDDIAELANGLREHDLNVGWAIGTVLRSTLFFSEANLGTHVVGPAEFVIGVARALEVFNPPPSTLVLADWMRRLGQDLFYPPNVGGWNEGRAWLTTRGVLSRANFAAALVHGELSSSSSVPNLQVIAERAGRGATTADAVAFFNDLLFGGSVSADELARVTQPATSLSEAVALLLATPEAQLA